MARFRKLRRKLFASMPSSEQRRAMRDRFLHRIGLQRDRRPTTVLKHPEFMLNNSLLILGPALLSRRPALNVVQVGAFDGLGDEMSQLLQRCPVKAVLVEPQPDVFKSLQQRYDSNPDYTLVNVAIADKPGQRQFYRVEGRDCVVASFDRNHLIKHGIESSNIEEIQVTCQPLSEILDAQSFDELDILQIDTEGYDYQVIRTIDFSRHKPTILRFEHVHLSPSDHDRCIELLAENGYHFIQESLDTIAIDLDRISRPSIAA